MPLPLLAIPALVQAGVGLGQAVFGGSKARKAERELENLKTPTYSGSKSIADLYNTALSRYNVSPYDSAAYRQQTQQIGRNFNAGLSALGDRRSALAGVGGLVAASNNAIQNAGVVAEGERNRRFGELTNATQLQTADDRMAFETNQMLPFQKQANLLAMKAGAANSRVNSGMQNLFAGIGNATSILSSGLNGATAAGGLGGATTSGNPEWQRIMNQYRGRTGNSNWDMGAALPVNDFKIPRN